MEAKNYRPRQRAQLCELAWKLLFEGKTPPEDALAAWADALTAAWSLPQPAPPCASCCGKLRPMLPTTRNWLNNTWMPSVLIGRLLQIQKTP